VKSVFRMHLKRVRVPDFRVLKDVDLTFEPDLVPRIFPLGSLNGGGKSTLLQLVFTLLHCSGDNDRIPYLQNMLDGFEVDDEYGEKDLATIDLCVDDKDIELKFICYTLDRISQEIEPQYPELNANLKFSVLTHKNKKYFPSQIQLSWLKDDLCYICDLESKETLNRVFLLCQFSGVRSDEVLSCLRSIRDRICLAAPMTQVFRFLKSTDRKLLFKGGNESHKYYSQVATAKTFLNGFFAYELLAVNILIQGFIKARDNDFAMAISNNGKYGDSYPKLLKDLEYLLVDKRVNIELDLASVGFSKVDSNDNSIELYPEDLSHGELKRLSLYMWLKFNKIENAIVLMDEVEIALHPDWQYQIVNDLQTWAPNNQYILATHSHELCQALTPAHVKEIEPKLIKK
jgi:AAA domain, putative AbiEii toxin, Type IV TA system